ncbi:hypothetical protein EJA71_26170 [Pseudomonas sp. PB106]|nr:hypothetical protein EJA71_26170 [Pseudomonas sp. PB106]
MGRRASRTAFPRGAWERSKIAAFGSSYRCTHDPVGAAEGSGRDRTIFCF